MYSRFDCIFTAAAVQMPQKVINELPLINPHAQRFKTLIADGCILLKESHVKIYTFQTIAEAEHRDQTENFQVS